MFEEKPQVDEQTKDMLVSFVQETIDSLDAAEPKVGELETVQNDETVNTIFRVFHTIKGIAGFFGLSKLTALTHQAEALLDLIRKQKQLQSADTITLIYDNFDLLREIVSSIALNFHDGGFEDKIQLNVERLHKKSKELTDLTANNDESAESRQSIIQLDLSMKKEEALNEIAANLLEQSLIDEESIPEEMMERFVISAYEMVNETENVLLEISKTSDAGESLNILFRNIHNLKGNAGFMQFSEVEKLCMQAETILDNLRKGEIDLNGGVSDFLFEQIDEIRNEINKAVQSKSKKKSEKEEQPWRAETKYIEPQPASIEEPPIIEANESESIVSKVANEAQKSIGSQIQRKDIRVDTQKLDALFDLVGELITLETMITKNPDLEGLDLPSFSKNANMLNKVIRELQEVTMAIRMTPLESLFNKMKRLVRDLALKSKKKVDLVIIGADTEMDKNIIEAISDPLVHIIRNSVDHGIESPKARLSAGKKESGTITLSAGYQGNEIIISILDDGGGLNKNKILQKARERGLLKEAADKYTDSEIYNLIFEAGFSTADKVTDISGRGVGMDVVRKNIDKLHGSIRIESVEKVRTQFTLRIPLTLAILDSMMILVGDVKYAIPIVAIKEALQPMASQISVTMDGLELIKVRDEIYPVIRLHEFLGKTPRYHSLEAGILIIIESRESKVCFFVDEILGQQQAVVKGLSDYVGKVKGVTGCMILSNGEVGLILDPDLIIKHALYDQPGFIN